MVGWVPFYTTCCAMCAALTYCAPFMKQAQCRTSKVGSQGETTNHPVHKVCVGALYLLSYELGVPLEQSFHNEAAPNACWSENA